MKCDEKGPHEWVSSRDGGPPWHLRNRGSCALQALCGAELSVGGRLVLSTPLPKGPACPKCMAAAATYAEVREWGSTMRCGKCVIGTMEHGPVGAPARWKCGITGWFSDEDAECRADGDSLLKVMEDCTAVIRERIAKTGSIDA